MKNSPATKPHTRHRSTQAQNRRPASPSRLEDSIGNSLRFLGSFLRQPAKVGSLLPSSATLARRLVDYCNLEHARSVVELGPGTGAFTGFILDRLHPNAVFLALELDRGHVQSLRKRFPSLKVYCDSAEHLQRYLKRHGAPAADCIVCGLPWANMGPGLQDRILAPVVESLHPEGVLVGFGYAHARLLPSTVRFRQRLRHYFHEVHTSRVVWRNLPPAFIYHCRGVRSHKAAASSAHPQ